MTRFIRQTPCAVLLAVQFLGVLLYPFLEDSLQSRQLFALFGLVVLGIVVFALRATPALVPIFRLGWDREVIPSRGIAHLCRNPSPIIG